MLTTPIHTHELHYRLSVNTKCIACCNCCDLITIKLAAAGRPQMQNIKKKWWTCCHTGFPYKNITRLTYISYSWFTTVALTQSWQADFLCLSSIQTQKGGTPSQQMWCIAASDQVFQFKCPLMPALFGSTAVLTNNPNLPCWMQIISWQFLNKIFKV